MFEFSTNTQTVTESDPPTLPPDMEFTDHLHSFVDQCLQKDPADRPIAKTLLGHPWLKSHECGTMKAATSQCKAWVDELLGVDSGVSGKK